VSYHIVFITACAQNVRLDADATRQQHIQIIQ